MNNKENPKNKWALLSDAADTQLKHLHLHIYTFEI